MLNAPPPAEVFPSCDSCGARLVRRQKAVGRAVFEWCCYPCGHTEPARIAGRVVL